MEIEIKGVVELKDAVDALREVGTRLGLFAKTMTMAADRIDEALTAHIAGMDMHASRLEAINGMQSSGTGESPASGSEAGT